jgi:hypothetical protein
VCLQVDQMYQCLVVLTVPSELAREGESYRGFKPRPNSQGRWMTGLALFHEEAETISDLHPGEAIAAARRNIPHTALTLLLYQQTSCCAPITAG